jgi:hypothetical protein
MIARRSCLLRLQLQTALSRPIHVEQLLHQQRGNWLKSKLWPLQVPLSLLQQIARDLDLLFRTRQH